VGDPTTLFRRRICSQISGHLRQDVHLGELVGERAVDLAAGERGGLERPLVGPVGGELALDGLERLRLQLGLVLLADADDEEVEPLAGVSGFVQATVSGRLSVAEAASPSLISSEFFSRPRRIHALKALSSTLPPAAGPSPGATALGQQRRFHLREAIDQHLHPLRGVATLDVAVGPEHPAG